MFHDEHHLQIVHNAEKGSDGIKFFGAAPEIMQAAIEENKNLGLRSTSHHAQLNVVRWNVLNSDPPESELELYTILGTSVTSPGCCHLSINL